MSRVKVVIVAALAVLALSAVAASSASATWFAGGTEITTLTALSTTAKVDALAILNLPVQKIKIDCSGALLKGESPDLSPGDRGQAAALIFEGCEIVEPANCSLSKLIIRTQAILATARLAAAPEDRVLFEPKGGTQFATIPFREGTACALEGEQPVKGKVNIKAPTGQNESVTQAIEGMGSVENNSLEVGAGNKAFIEGGKALITLASGIKWSFK